MSVKVLDYNSWDTDDFETFMDTMIAREGPAFFYEHPSKLDTVIVSDKELTDQEIADVTVGKDDVITDPDEPIWEDGEDIDTDWLLL